MAYPNPHRLSPNDIGPRLLLPGGLGKDPKRTLTTDRGGACLLGTSQWSGASNGHYEGLTGFPGFPFKGDFNDPMIRGANCWMFIRYKVQHEVFLFPKEFVQGVCRYLEVDDKRLILNDHSGPVSLDAFPEVSSLIGHQIYPFENFDNIPDETFREFEQQGAQSVLFVSTAATSERQVT
jgi:hypothetical protein